MSLKNIVKLIAGATIALSAVTAHAGDDDYKKGCKLSTLKGTYSFSNVSVHAASEIPAAFSAGFIYFDGAGNATLQTTDNDGGGAGTTPHLTTVTALTTNSEGVTQTEPGACVYNLQATLAVTAANCGYPVNLNLFVDGEGKDLNAISTGAYPGLITAFSAKRFSEKNILVKGVTPAEPTTPCVPVPPLGLGG